MALASTFVVSHFADDVAEFVRIGRLGWWLCIAKRPEFARIRLRPNLGPPPASKVETGGSCYDSVQNRAERDNPFSSDIPMMLDVSLD